MLYTSFAFNKENVLQVIKNRSDYLQKIRHGEEVDEKHRWTTSKYVQLNYDQDNKEPSSAYYKFKLDEPLERNRQHHICQFGKVLNSKNTLIKLKVKSKYAGKVREYSSIERISAKDKSNKSLICLPFMSAVDPVKADIEYEVHILKDGQKERKAERRDNVHSKATVQLTQFWVLKSGIDIVLTPAELNREVTGPCPNPLWENQVWGTLTDEFDNPVPGQIGIVYHPKLKPGQTKEQWFDDLPKSFKNKRQGLYSDLIFTNISWHGGNTSTKWCAEIPPNVEAVFLENYSRVVKNSDGEINNRADDFGYSSNHDERLDLSKPANRIDIVLPNKCGTVNNTKDDTGRIVFSTFINGKKVEKGIDTLQFNKSGEKVERAQPYRTIAFHREFMNESDPRNLKGYGAVNSEYPGNPDSINLSGLEPRQKYLVNVFTQKSWELNGREYHWKYVADINPDMLSPNIVVNGCEDTYVQVNIEDNSITEATSEKLKDPRTHTNKIDCRVKVWYQGSARPGDSKYRKKVNDVSRESQYGPCTEIQKVPLSANDGLLDG